MRPCLPPINHSDRDFELQQTIGMAMFGSIESTVFDFGTFVESRSSSPRKRTATFCRFDLIQFRIHDNPSNTLPKSDLIMRPWRADRPGSQSQLIASAHFYREKGATSSASLFARVTCFGCGTSNRKIRLLLGMTMRGLAM